MAKLAFVICAIFIVTFAESASFNINDYNEVKEFLDTIVVIENNKNQTNTIFKSFPNHIMKIKAEFLEEVHRTKEETANVIKNLKKSVSYNNKENNIECNSIVENFQNEIIITTLVAQSCIKEIEKMFDTEELKNWESEEKNKTFAFFEECKNEAKNCIENIQDANTGYNETRWIKAKSCLKKVQDKAATKFTNTNSLLNYMRAMIKFAKEHMEIRIQRCYPKEQTINKSIDAKEKLEQCDQVHTPRLG